MYPQYLVFILFLFIFHIELLYFKDTNNIIVIV